MKSKNLTEIIFCCIVMLFLAVLLVMSRGLPPNSARLPILIGGITLTLAAVQLVINIKEKASMGKNSAEDRPFVAKEMIIKVGVTGLFMVLTLVLWYLLGFLPAALISSMLLALYLGERRWLVIVLSCGISVVVLYFLFSELLSVPLPKGVLFGGHW